MQEPIRYYITQIGEEPTVRSVKVAQDAPEAQERVVPSADAVVEPNAPARSTSAPAKAVERLMKSAFRGRASEA